MTLPFAQLSFPEMYEEVLVEPLFRPWVDDLLDGVGLKRGERVLDVACGTGIVARHAQTRVGDTGHVVGVDVNGGMLAVARRVAPAVEWREGNATELPLQPGEEFDVVTCQQGFQFMPDKAAAVREFRRALAPKGRVGISAWRSDEDLEVLRELRRIAERHVGPIDDRRHSFGEREPVEALLRDAGFTDVKSRTESRTIEFRDGEMFVRLNAMALVGMSANGKELSDADRERITEEIVRDSADIVAQNTNDGKFAYEISTNVTTAHR